MSKSERIAYQKERVRRMMQEKRKKVQRISIAIPVSKSNAEKNVTQ